MSDEVSLPKGQKDFRLNEVCKVAKVQPYMLRFWATEFPDLEAEKSGTGQRRYTRKQVERILQIRQLLFDEGLTIAGAKKRLAKEAEAGAKGSRRKTAQKKSAAKATEAAEATETVDKQARKRVQELGAALREVRDELAGAAAVLEKDD